MTQQSPTRSFLVGATFRGPSRAPRPESALARLALAGLLGGLLPSFAWAQYPTTTPSMNYGASQNYGVPQTATAQAPASQNAANVSADPQFAGQTDEQLAAEARLFMQQGRSAPAQRIYLELQRRSIIRSSALTQTPSPTFNHQTPAGFSAYGSTPPSATGLTPTWGNGMAPGYATSQRQVVPSPYSPGQSPSAFQPFQPTPQLQANTQSARAAENWAQAGANGQPANNPPAATAQTVDNENFSPQTLPSPAAVPTPRSGFRSNAAPEVTVSTVAEPPVMVLDRPQSASSKATSATFTSGTAATSTTPTITHNSNGWRAAITPLPAALAQGAPSGKPTNSAKTAAPAPFDTSLAAKPVSAAASNAGHATPTQPSAVPVSNVQSTTNPGTAATPAAGETQSISTAHPLELAREAARQAADELPNFHTQPLPDLPSRKSNSATEPTATAAATPGDQEPAAFKLPGARGERRVVPTEPTEPAEAPGVVTLPSASTAALPPAAPPPIDLSPRQVRRTVPLATDRETSKSIVDEAAKLAKQTDDIRIIPGNPRGGSARLETLLNVEGKNASTPPDSAFDIPTSGWKSTIPNDSTVTTSTATSTPSALEKATTDSAAPTTTDRPRRDNFDDERPTPRRVGNDSFRSESFRSDSFRRDSLADSNDAAEPRASRAPRAAHFDDERRIDEERRAEPKAAFDLAALIRDPEFREIHTRPVLDGLELLSQAEPRHRLLGAMRIGLSGPEARTALPVLHQLLTTEPNKGVRARVAEAILKLQPNNRPALDTLSRLLIDPSDADVRQAAAGALGGASATANASAIVCLTDALDDASPRVRIMAALSLAQFGPAAVDAVPRLETAAANDVPRMQRAALAALASIRGGQSTLGPTAVATPAGNVEAPARETAVAPTSGPLELASPAAPSREVTVPQRKTVERTQLDKPDAGPMLFPDLGRPTPADGKLHGLTPTNESPTNRAAASRGISLHEEIGSDGASEGHVHHAGEP